MRLDPDLERPARSAANTCRHVQERVRAVLCIVAEEKKPYCSTSIEFVQVPGSSGHEVQIAKRLAIGHGLPRGASREILVTRRTSVQRDAVGPRKALTIPSVVAPRVAVISQVPAPDGR